MLDDQLCEGGFEFRSDQQPVVFDANAVGFRFTGGTDMQCANGERSFLLIDSFRDQADALQDFCL